MPTAKTTEDETKDWGEASPASPKEPGKTGRDLGIPRNASRDDLLRIRESAQEALKDNPNYETAKAVITECDDRLRWFTPTGLPVPRPEKAAEAESEAETETEDWPNNPTMARKLYQQIKGEPLKSRSLPAKMREQAAKKKRLRSLGAHIARLEAGQPVIHLTANDQAKSTAMSHDTIRAEKLKILSRTIPEVKQLLDELAVLKKSTADMDKSLSDAATELAALKKENAELNKLLKKA